MDMPDAPLPPQFDMKISAKQSRLNAALVRSKEGRPPWLATMNDLFFREVSLTQAYAFKIVIAPLVFYSGSAQAGVEYSLVEPLAVAAKPFE